MGGSAQGNGACKIRQPLWISVRLVRLPLSYLSFVTPVLGWVMQPPILVSAGTTGMPCTWLMGYIPRVLGTLIRMVLPQAIHIKVGSVCMHIWHIWLAIGRLHTCIWDSSRLCWKSLHRIFPARFCFESCCRALVFTGLYCFESFACLNIASSAVL